MMNSVQFDRQTLMLSSEGDFCSLDELLQLRESWAREVELRRSLEFGKLVCSIEDRPR